MIKLKPRTGRLLFGVLLIGIGALLWKAFLTSAPTDTTLLSLFYFVGSPSFSAIGLIYLVWSLSDYIKNTGWLSSLIDWLHKPDER